MIRITEYKAGDQPHFERLNRAWIEKYFSMEAMDDYLLTKPEEAIIKKGGTILFARSDDEVTGVVAIIKEDDHTFKFAKMTVDENHRRKGIAEALGKAAIAKVRELRGAKLILFPHTRLQPALLLYRKLGFVEVPFEAETEIRRANIKMEMMVD